MKPVLLATLAESYHNKGVAFGTEIRPMKSRLVFLFLTATVWLGNLPSGFAQTPDSQNVDKRSLSHILIPIQGGDFKALDERFRQLQQMNTAPKDQFEKEAK